MSTQLGNVSIKLTLDLSEAQRQLDDLENKAEGAGSGTERPAKQGGPQSSWFGKPDRGPNQMSKKQVKRYFEKISNERDKENHNKYLQGIANYAVKNRNANFYNQVTSSGPTTANYNAPPTISNLKSAFPTAANVLGKVTNRFGLGGMNTIGPASTAALAGALFVGGTEAGKAGPGLEGFASGLFGSKDTGIGKIARVAQEWGSGLQNILASYSSSKKQETEFRHAVARVTGTSPTIPLSIPFTSIGFTSSSALWGILQKGDLAFRNLQSKFESFKDNEIGFATGKYVRDSFKRAFNK